MSTTVTIPATMSAGAAAADSLRMAAKGFLQLSMAKAMMMNSEGDGELERLAEKLDHYRRRDFGRFAKVTLQSAVFGVVTFEFETNLSGTKFLVCKAWVPDRADPTNKIEICSYTPIFPNENYSSDPVRCAELVRRALIDLITHEVDEMLLLDGVRYRDPHK